MSGGKVPVPIPTTAPAKEPSEKTKPDLSEPRGASDGEEPVRIIPLYSTREHNSHDCDAKPFSRSTFTLLLLPHCQ